MGVGIVTDRVVAIEGHVGDTDTFATKWDARS